MLCQKAVYHVERGVDAQWATEFRLRHSAAMLRLTGRLSIKDPARPLSAVAAHKIEVCTHNLIRRAQCAWLFCRVGVCSHFGARGAWVDAVDANVRGGA